MVQRVHLNTLEIDIKPKFLASPQNLMQNETWVKFKRGPLIFKITKWTLYHTHFTLFNFTNLKRKIILIALVILDLRQENTHI